jgi:hypothetical protein
MNSSTQGNHDWWQASTVAPSPKPPHVLRLASCSSLSLLAPHRKLISIIRHPPMWALSFSGEGRVRVVVVLIKLVLRSSCSRNFFSMKLADHHTFSQKRHIPHITLLVFCLFTWEPRLCPGAFPEFGPPKNSD